MFQKLEAVEKRFEELTIKISDPEVIANQNEWREFMKEHAELEPIVEKYREYKKIQAQYNEAKEMIEDASIDKELKDLAEMEMLESKEKLPKIEEENIFFTTDMEESVKTFQEVFDLPVTGIVDKGTWYEVKYLYNAVKRIADLGSEGISIEEVEFPYGDTLQEGDSGPYIRPLNYLLNFLSYFDSDIPRLNLSGEDFTEDTKEMVIAFQTDYDIDATGIVDKNTWNALVTAYNQTREVIPEEYLYYEDKLYPGIFLSRGMSGDDILNLQNFLYTVCEKTHQIPGVRVTGTFDELTEESIKSIQKRYNLPENGVVGPATWQKIIEWVESLE